MKEGDSIVWYDGKDFTTTEWKAKTYCSRGIKAARHQLQFHPEVKRVHKCSDSFPLQIKERLTDNVTEVTESATTDSFAVGNFNAGGEEVENLG